MSYSGLAYAVLLEAKTPMLGLSRRIRRRGGLRLARKNVFSATSSPAESSVGTQGGGLMSRFNNLTTAEKGVVGAAALAGGIGLKKMFGGGSSSESGPVRKAPRQYGGYR